MTAARWLGAPALLFVIAGLLVPLAVLALPVFGDFDAGLLSRSEFGAAFWGSIWLGAVGGFVATVIGLAIAVSLTRVGANLRRAILALSSMPLALSAVVIAFGFILMFGRSGTLPLLLREATGSDVLGDVLFSPQGLVIVYLYFLIPRAIFVLYPAIAALDFETYRVARLLGAGPARAVYDALLPQIVPAFVSAVSQCFAVAVGSYGAALALLGSGADLLPLQLIASFAKGQSGQDDAVIYGLVIVAVSLAGGLLTEAFRRN